MTDNKKVETELNKANPWYTDEQLLNIGSPIQKRTIKQRWDFFNKIIQGYKQKHPHKILKILDAGCGDGINLSFLSQISKAQIFACDYNPLRVKRAKTAFPKIKDSQQDLTKPKLDQKDFDVITSGQRCRSLDTLISKQRVGRTDNVTNSLKGPQGEFENTQRTLSLIKSARTELENKFKIDLSDPDKTLLIEIDTPIENVPNIMFVDGSPGSAVTLYLYSYPGVLYLPRQDER